MNHRAPFDLIFDEFNQPVPEDRFPQGGMSARAAKATVNSEAWADCQPVMNLSSFVTTFTEPESLEIAHQHKINPAVLMGATAGARSHSGPAREAAKEVNSSVPWIGFPMGYAISGVLLTVFGYVAMVLKK